MEISRRRINKVLTHLEPEKVAAAAESKTTELQRMAQSTQVHLYKKNVNVATHIAEECTIDKIHVYTVPQLKDWLPDHMLVPRKNKIVRTKLGNCGGDQHYNQEISPDQIVLVDLIRKKSIPSVARAFVRAGPRGTTVWDPKEVKAAIVTCGGLCPGLNDVVCELVKTLYFNYGVDTIYGINNGFRGFWDKHFWPYRKLTPDNTFGIHALGGTVLGSSRGGQDPNLIWAAMKKNGINQMYVIGGDGSHRGALDVFHLAKAEGVKVSVVGIPKTIDNDIALIDRSFGFYTAVEQAKLAIKSVFVEATASPYGIGIVKLMGRSSGMIAVHATLASRDVDLCLIPEVRFELTGPNGIFHHIESNLRAKKFCIVVVAEGAGSNILPPTGRKDASGNPVLPEIGDYLKTEIKKYCKNKGIDADVKYNDPSYMIRSVAANASDSVYCMETAQNAVHGAMAGLTGFSSGRVNNRTVYIPLDLVKATSPTHLNPMGRTWERVICSTHQPNTMGTIKTFQKKS